MLGYSCEHPWSNLFAIVKGEDEVGPTVAGQYLVRAALPNNAPSETKQRSEYHSSARRNPLCHDGYSRGEGYGLYRGDTELPGLNPVRQHAECQRSCQLSGLLLSVAVDQNTGQLGDLGYPTAVHFLLELDGESHVTQLSMALAAGLAQDVSLV